MDLRYLATMMTDEVPADADGSVTATEETTKKSGGCFKWVLGCGCLMMIAFLAIGIIGGIAIWKAPQAVGADSWGETVEFLDGAKDVASKTSGNSGAMGGEPADLNELAKSSDPEDQEEFDQAVTGLNDFFDELDDTTISSRDISKSQENFQEWNDSKVVGRFNEVFEKIEDIDEDDESISGLLQKARATFQFAFRANDLGREYGEHFDQYSEAERNNHNQLIALVRVSQFSTPSGMDPWSQEVADALIEDHDENRDDYEEAQELFRAAMEDPDFDAEELSEEEQNRLGEAFANQFTMATSAINRDSLVTWSELSDEERKEIIETVDEPHNFVARIMAGTVHATEDEAHLFYVRLLGF